MDHSKGALTARGLRQPDAEFDRGARVVEQVGHHVHRVPHPEGALPTMRSEVIPAVSWDEILSDYNPRCCGRLFSALKCLSREGFAPLAVHRHDPPARRQRLPAGRHDPIWHLSIIRGDQGHLVGGQSTFAARTMSHSPPSGLISPSSVSCDWRSAAAASTVDRTLERNQRDGMQVG